MTGFTIPLSERRLARLVAPEPYTEDDAEAGPLPGYADIIPYLDRLPALEADALELHAAGCRMTDIGHVLALADSENPHKSRTGKGGQALTQGAITYVTQNGVRRARYLRWLDSLDLNETKIRTIARKVGTSERHVPMIVGMWRLGGFTEVSRALGCTQSSVANAWTRFGIRIVSVHHCLDLAAVRAWIAGIWIGGLSEHRRRRSHPAVITHSGRVLVAAERSGEARDLHAIERRVLDLRGAGLTYRAIGAELGLTHTTVRATETMARKRLAYFFWLDSLGISEPSIRTTGAILGLRPSIIEVAAQMWRLGSHSTVARVLNIRSREQVWHRWDRWVLAVSRARLKTYMAWADGLWAGGLLGRRRV